MDALFYFIPNSVFPLFAPYLSLERHWGTFGGFIHLATKSISSSLSKFIVVDAEAKSDQNNVETVFSQMEPHFHVNYFICDERWTSLFPFPINKEPARIRWIMEEFLLQIKCNYFTITFGILSSSIFLRWDAFYIFASLHSGF